MGYLPKNVAITILILGPVMFCACSDDDGPTSGGDAATTDGALVPDGSAHHGDAYTVNPTLSKCFSGISAKSNSFVGILDFEDQAGSTIIRLARKSGVQPPEGMTESYTLVRFGLVREGKTECITDEGYLFYRFNTNNWDDKAEALSGTIVYAVSMVYDEQTGAWTDTLEAKERGSSSVLWGPLALKNTACSSIPADTDHCRLR